MKDNSLTKLAAQLTLLENQMESDSLPHLLPGMKQEILSLEEERLRPDYDTRDREGGELIPEEMMRGQLLTAEAALNYILAGNAYFTVRSKKTGTRFTFRVAIPKWARKESRDVFYVSLLSGPDNEHNYSYMGLIRGGRFSLAKKSLITQDAPSYKAFEFTMMALGVKHLPTTLEIWHEGRCGRCGRKLTVPESVERGIGPECAEKMKAA